MAKLTVMSCGAGQDSTAIIYKLIFDPEFRQRYAPEDLLVVMSDTGNEHDTTNEHRKYLQDLCYKHDIFFKFIDCNKDGYHPKGWIGGLVEFFKRGNRIGSKAYPKTCTDNLKIKPIYNWLEEHIYIEYGLEEYGRKKAFHEFKEKYGKIDVLLGIAAGEESRASSNEDSLSVWMRETINKVYPLLDLGMNRKDCQDYIKAMELPLPPPSNCIFCPFLSYQELLYLYRTDPKRFQEWVEHEARKLKANAHVENNLGVWGKKGMTLLDALEEAMKRHGDMTIEELHDYKMSHGHCVMSKY